MWPDPLVIFDLDGTLVDSEHAHFLSWQRAASLRGRELTQEQYAPFAGHAGDAIALQLDPQAPEAAWRDKKLFYREIQSRGIQPIVRTVEFARQLGIEKKHLGIKLGLASAAPREEIDYNLRHLNIKEIFDVVVSGCDDLAHIQDPEGVNKPKPYIYLEAARLLGLDPKRCVAFEDSATGVTSAVEAGLLTFAVPNFYTQAQDHSRAYIVLSPDTPLDVVNFFTHIDAWLR